MGMINSTFDHASLAESLMRWNGFVASAGIVQILWRRLFKTEGKSCYQTGCAVWTVLTTGSCGIGNSPCALRLLWTGVWREGNHSWVCVDT